MERSSVLPLVTNTITIGIPVKWLSHLLNNEIVNGPEIRFPFMDDPNEFFLIPAEHLADPNIITEAEWNTLPWNPQGEWHGGVPFRHDIDPKADPKPTWKQITNWFTTYLFDQTDNEALELLNEMCTQAITEAYGASSRQKEINIRLAGEATPAQNKERLRLIARCHAVEAEIKVADTQAKLEAIKTKVIDGSWKNEPKSDDA